MEKAIVDLSAEMQDIFCDSIKALSQMGYKPNELHQLMLVALEDLENEEIKEIPRRIAA